MQVLLSVWMCWIGIKIIKKGCYQWVLSVDSNITKKCYHSLMFTWVYVTCEWCLLTMTLSVILKWVITTHLCLPETMAKVKGLTTAWGYWRISDYGNVWISCKISLWGSECSVKLLFCSKLIRIILSDGCLLLRYRSIKRQYSALPTGECFLYMRLTGHR